MSYNDKNTVNVLISIISEFIPKYFDFLPLVKRLKTFLYKSLNMKYFSLRLIKMLKLIFFITGNTIYFNGVDMVNGTPVLDIKPYIPQYDYPQTYGEVLSALERPPTEGNNDNVEMMANLHLDDDISVEGLVEFYTCKFVAVNSAVVSSRVGNGEGRGLADNYFNFTHSGNKIVWR